MMGRTPNRKSVQAVRLAVSKSSKVQDDKVRAIKLWNDFRWNLKKIPDRTYPAIEKLIDESIVAATTLLETEAVRDTVVQRFNEMRNRISEFTVAPSDDQKPESEP